MISHFKTNPMSATKHTVDELAERDGFLEDLHSRQPSFYQIDLATVQPTKSAIQPMAEAMLQVVDGGTIRPEEMIVKLKFLSEVFEEVRSQLNDTVRTEAEKHKEGMQVLEAKIECAEVGTAYDYTADVVWKRLKSELVPIQEKIKEREALLKTLKHPMEVVEADGEVVKIFPAIKTSKSSVKVTLGK